MASYLRPGARDVVIAPLNITDSRPRATRLIGRVIFYGLLALMVLIAIPYGGAQPWSEALFECVVFALALLFVIEGYLSGSWRIQGATLFYPCIALIVLSLLQSLPLWQVDVPAASSVKVWFAISADPYESRRFALKIAALAIAGVLMMRYTTTRKRLITLISVVIGISLVSGVFGILRQTLQHEKGFILPDLVLRSGYAQFLNKNHYAFMAEMALGLGLGLIVARGVRRDRLLIWAAVLLVIWTALVLSNSRGGLLAMTGQLVFTLLLFIRSRTGKGSRASKEARSGGFGHFARSLFVQTVLVSGLLIAVIVGAIWIGGDPLVSSIETSSVELQSKQSEVHDGARRRDIWRASWQMIKEHKFAGVGLGGYWAAVPQYHDGSGLLIPTRAHNEYIELLASGGIIGAAIGLWFLVLLIRRVRAGLRSSDLFYRACACGVTIAILGVAVHSLFDFGLHITVNAMIFVSLLAILGMKERCPTCFSLSSRFATLSNDTSHIESSQARRQAEACRTAETGHQDQNVAQT